MRARGVIQTYQRLRRERESLPTGDALRIAQLRREVSVLPDSRQQKRVLRRLEDIARIHADAALIYMEQTVVA